MRIQQFTVLLCMAFLCLGCGSDREELFVVENEVEFTLLGGLNTIETHVFVIQNVPTFIESNLETFGYTRENIGSISAARGSLSAVVGEVDYDFIQEISVRAIHPGDPTLNREMYYREEIPFTHNGDLRMLSSISELKDILSNSIVDLEVRILLREFSPRDIQAKLNFSYAVFETE